MGILFCMPRMLNLNDFGAKLIAVAAVLGIAVPGLFYVFYLLLNVFQVEWPWLLALARGSLGLGLALLGLLLVLVILEQIQDRWIVRAFDRQRGRRLPAPGGLFECQYCGNRRVRPEDKVCAVCGKDFESPV